MFKKWMAMALLAGWLGSPMARAQYLPQAGPAPVPEPLPCGPTPNLVPGPISPLAAPRGPSDDLSLPPNIKNAFPCEECPAPKFIYFHAGTQALQRQRLGHGITAFVNNNDLSRLDTGINPIPPFLAPGATPILTTALPADIDRLGQLVPGIAPVQDLNNLEPDMALGFRGTLGCLLEGLGCAVELTGFYIPQNSANIEAIDPGRINSFFFNPPLGFEGNNGLFLQADRVRATQETTLGSAELNIRTFSKIFTGLEPLIGVRYINLQERFSLLFDDDGLSFPDFFGQPDPFRIATYSTRVRSNIVAPQVGFEYQKGLFKGVALGLLGKAAAGINFADIYVNLERGDAFPGLRGFRHRRNFTQVYEAGGFLDVYVLERARLRAGYTALWIANVPEAVDQVSFDLSAPLGRQDNTGTIFYHGPSLELQLLF